MFADRLDPRTLAAFSGLAAAIVSLHLAHLLGGHGWYSRYGPGLALLLTAAILAALRVRRSGPWLGPSAALVSILVAPEWVEGELAARHPVEWETLESHGAATIAILGLAGAAVMLWEASRVLTVIWPR